MKSIIRFSQLSLLFLFSVFSALGTWNPFVAYDADIEEPKEFFLSQVISILFVGSLFLFNKISTKVVVKYHISLILFFSFMVFSTLMRSFSSLEMEDTIFFLKLLLEILLCIKLPSLLVKYPKWLYFSIFSFSLICSIIALYYTFGYMEQYLVISKGRIMFWGENPNSTSSRYALAILFMLHIIVRNPFKWKMWRHVFWVTIPPLVNVVIATGSRGSFLILLVCVIVYLWSIHFKHRTYKFFFVLFLPTFLFFSISYYIHNNTDYSMLERLTMSLNEGEDAGRHELNQYTQNIFIDYPLFGTGVKLFQELMASRYSESRTAHNLYLYLLAVSGIVGFAFFFYFLFSLLKYSLSIRSQEALPLTIFFYILFIAYKTGGILTYMLMWYSFSIIISLISLVYEERNNNRFVRTMDID